jgi:hypothetical protein
MFKTDCGKLMVYASTVAPHRARLQSVRTATEKTARLLNLGFEVVRFKKSFSQIYVYYENGDDEPIPIYCDEGKTCNQQEICTTLKNMMFVLSFHPKHSALRQVQKEIMRLS